MVEYCIQYPPPPAIRHTWHYSSEICQLPLLRAEREVRSELFGLWLGNISMSGPTRHDYPMLLTSLYLPPGRARLHEVGGVDPRVRRARGERTRLTKRARPCPLRGAPVRGCTSLCTPSIVTDITIEEHRLLHVPGLRMYRVFPG